MDDVSGTGSRAAKQIRQVGAAGLQVSAGDCDIEGRDEAGGGLVHAGSLESGGVFVCGQVAVGHFRASDAGDDLGEPGDVVGCAAKFVSPVPGLVAEQCRGCCGGVVLAGGSGHPAVAGRADYLASG